MALWGSQAHRSFVLASSCSPESLSGEEQCAPSAPGAPKARPATPGLGSRIRAIQESVGKVGAGQSLPFWGPSLTCEWLVHLAYLSPCPQTLPCPGSWLGQWGRGWR